MSATIDELCYVGEDEPQTAVDLERMIHPEEARARFSRALRRFPAQGVPLRDATWRSRTTWWPAENSPHFQGHNDGYAVVAEDPSPWREIVGRQTAGDVADLEVSLGTAAWITRRPGPARCDRSRAGGGHRVRRRSRHRRQGGRRTWSHHSARRHPHGQGFRPAEAGSSSVPAEVAPVRRLRHRSGRGRATPPVSVLSTGNEFVEPAETPGPGEIATRTASA